MRIDLPRQRQLDEHPVDAVVTVQPFDFGGEPRFRYVARQANVECADIRGGARTAFGTHINLAGRVVSDQDGRETGRSRDLGPQARRDFAGSPA